MTSIIEANISNANFSVSQLANEMGMSRSNLYHKVYAIKKKSISQFIREIRLEKAMKLLRNKAGNISEIAYETGFGSPAYFTRCFHEFYGFSPGQMAQNDQAINDLKSKNHQKVSFWNISSTRQNVLFSAVAIIGLVIIALTIFQKITESQREKKNKSILVLPFPDESPDPKNAFITKGLREEIINKLCLIKDLRVVSSTSSEGYRNSNKSLKEIGRELNVNYIVEGSTQTINNSTRIRLQLIEASTDKHLWSKPYERIITENNIFEIQREVALSVANELNAVITPGEQEKIKKTPTQNLAAYNLYLRGLDYLRLGTYSQLDNKNNHAALAKKSFEQSIELDSTFSEAYSMLGHIYVNNLTPWGKDPTEAFQLLDTGLTYLEKALLYDENNQQAIACIGQYYLKKGMTNEANKYFSRLSKTNTNDSYFETEFNKHYDINDYYNAIKSYYRYLETTDKLIIPPYIIQRVSLAFSYTGHLDAAKETAKKLLLYKDTAGYLSLIASADYFSGNFSSLIENALKIRQSDSTNIEATWNLITGYFYLRDYEKALKNIERLEKQLSKYELPLTPNYNIGYVYLKKGMTGKAQYHIKGAKEKYEKTLRSEAVYPQKYNSHLCLAATYAIMGKKEKAFEHLKDSRKENPKTLPIVMALKNHPGIDNLRSDRRFQEILKEIETNYLKEHEKTGTLITSQKPVN